MVPDSINQAAILPELFNFAFSPTNTALQVF